MAIYYGVVRDNRIELEGAARLADGTRVEVHTPSSTPRDMAVDEAVAKARLRAAGLLGPTMEIDGVEDPEEEFEPVVIRGELLSEQIIRERR